MNNVCLNYTNLIGVDLMNTGIYKSATLANFKGVYYDETTIWDQEPEDDL